MSHIDEGELTAYADGAYAPGEADALRIEAHLAECANCRNRLAQAQSLTARASEIVAIATPLNVTPVPFETIAARSTRTTTRWMPYAWAASLIMAVGLGWLMRDSLMMREADAPQVAIAPSPAAPQSIENDAKVETAETGATPTQTVTAQTRPVARPEEPARDATVVDAAGPPPPAAAPSIASAGNASGEGAARLELSARVVTESDTLHIIPGLEIVSSRMEGNKLVTTQKLPDGVLVTLIRDNALVARDKAAAKSIAATEQEAVERKMADLKLPEAVVRRGVSTITIKGPLSADSLKALAAKIR